MDYLRSLSKASLIAYSLITISAAILFATIYYVWTIDVITDWTIAVPDKPIHVGDTIIVESRYTKLRDVTPGYAKRYIDCTTKEGVDVSHPINEAIADKTAGKKKATGIEMLMPAVPNVPTTCSIRIHVSYPVMPLRTVHEINSSNKFTLLPKQEPTSSLNANPLSAEASQSLYQASGQNSSSYSEGTSTTKTTQSNSSQTSQSNQSQTTTPPEEEPGTIEKLIKIIQGVL